MMKIVIWGTSGHARVVADILKLQQEYSIYGFLDDVYVERHGMDFLDFPVLGGKEQLSKLQNVGVNHIILGFGNCRARLELTRELLKSEWNLGKALHPKSVIAQDAEIGDGTVVVAGAVVNSAVRIGKSVIVNTLAGVDHDCVIEDGVHICPGVHLGGHTTIGEGSWIGIGSTISDHVTIGSNSIIGAGAVVVRDIPSNVVAYGTPARVVRENTV